MQPRSIVEEFTFEVSLKATCVHNNATAQILEELGVLEKLQFLELPEILRIRGANFDIPVLSRDPEGLIARLSDQFPDEKEGIRAVVQEMIGIADETQRIAHEKGSDEEESGEGFFPPISKDVEHQRQDPCGFPGRLCEEPRLAGHPGRAVGVFRSPSLQAVRVLLRRCLRGIPQERLLLCQTTGPSTE